jgi:hypothetical protein
MSKSPREPLHPLFLLLLLAGLVFTVTAVAWAFVPVLEQKAADAGQPPPPSEFRDNFRANGGTYLLWELAILIVLGLAYMFLDRQRTLKTQVDAATIPPNPIADCRLRIADSKTDGNAAPASHAPTDAIVKPQSAIHNPQ